MSSVEVNIAAHPSSQMVLTCTCDDMICVDSTTIPLVIGRLVLVLS